MDLNQNYRSFVLAIAQHPRVQELIRKRGGQLVQRFVAGETLEEALSALRRLEAEGIHGILDLLGEMVHSEAGARAFQQEILKLIEALAREPFPRQISLKLSQLGQDQGEELVLELMRGILKAAAQVDCLVWIDMEDSSRVEATLKTYRTLKEEGHGVGIVLQSYLKRSESDLESLLPLGGAVRIVKGAYAEPPEVAYTERRLIDAQYLLLAKRALQGGLYTAIATHDPSLIEEMKRWTQAQGRGKESFEFQMLYGVRRDEQRRLAQEGYTIRAYIPYGTEWYPYLSRRVAERPQNLLFAARSLVEG